MNPFGAGGLSATSGVNSRNEFGGNFASGNFGSNSDDSIKFLLIGAAIALVVALLLRKL